MAIRGIILVCFVLLSTALVVENILYTCQEGTITLEAPFGAMDPHCEQSWTTGKKPIAYYKNGKGECSFPCKHVFSGKVILRECPDVILTTGCTTKDGVYEETRLHFSVITRPTVSMTTTNTANKQFYGLGAFLILLVSMIIQFVL